MRSSPEDTADTLETGYRPTNLLLRSSYGAEPAPCPAQRTANRRQLLVSLSGNAETRIAARSERAELVDEVAVLTAEEMRSAAAASEAAGRTTVDAGTELSWATVQSAGDLSEIGVKIDRCLSSWSDGPRVEICFDSISALLAEADLPSVFRFLHILMRRIEAADAVAHYHVDPTRHGRHVISTVEVLFDHVREYDERTGSWTDPPRRRG
jgi:hypothetical protein